MKSLKQFAEEKIIVLKSIFLNELSLKELNRLDIVATQIILESAQFVKEAIVPAEQKWEPYEANQAEVWNQARQQMLDKFNEMINENTN